MVEYVIVLAFVTLAVVFACSRLVSAERRAAARTSSLVGSEYP